MFIEKETWLLNDGRLAANIWLLTEPVSCVTEALQQILISRL